MKEIDLKRWLRSNWSGWMESYEPARGGGVGVADVQLALRGVIIPIELKLGKCSNGLLFPHEVRPDQIAWHMNCSLHGISSFFLVGNGVGKKPDELFLFPGRYARLWKHGIPSDKFVRLVPVHDLNTALEHFGFR